MATQIGQLVGKTLMDAVASPEQSTKGLTGSAEHKRAFFETFRRWEILFKRKDTGDEQAAKWLIAEYYDSLGHLSPEGFNVLTRLLKESCIFFPSIKECLDAMRPRDHYDWAHPFLDAARGRPSPLIAAKPNNKAIAFEQQARLAAMPPADEYDG